MRPGTLWVLKGDMVKDEWARDEKKYKQHDLPYIVPVIFRMTGLDVMDKGTPAIYMGETRVEERDDTARGGTVRLLRGVFLIGGVRYMTFNMNEFEPASVKSIDSVVQ